MVELVPDRREAPVEMNTMILPATTADILSKVEMGIIPPISQ
jgi:hypothetical protein